VGGGCTPGGAGGQRGQGSCAAGAGEPRLLVGNGGPNTSPALTGSKSAYNCSAGAAGGSRRYLLAPGRCWLASWQAE
jgi:hypothetical protein